MNDFHFYSVRERKCTNKLPEGTGVTPTRDVTVFRVAFNGCYDLAQRYLMGEVQEVNVVSYCPFCGKKLDKLYAASLKQE